MQSQEALIQPQNASFLTEALRAARFYLGWPDADFARDLADSLAPKMPPDASPGWLRVAIRRECVREARRRARFEPLSACERAVSEDVARVLDVERAMERLPANTLGVLYLRLLGHEFNEIGERAGCSSDAARQRVSEATKQLRGMLCQKQ